MTQFPIIAADQVVRKLQHPGKKVRIVIDTDTFNEIDDQFAVVYAMKSADAIQIEALHAAPFFNELSTGPADGMEKSYQELLKIRKLMDREDILVFRGSTAYLPADGGLVESEAARNLVELAMQSPPEEPLYVVAIGAITNVASAMLMEPRIIERIVVVWLGGHALNWPDTMEFNLQQDVPASRIIFDSGVPLIHIPCMGVASNLATSLSEIRDHIKDAGPIGNYLYETYKNCAADHFAYTRIIWDISTIAWLVNPDWCPSTLVQSPRISDDKRWIPDSSRHLIRSVRHIYRDSVFKDLFLKLAQQP